MGRKMRTPKLGFRNASAAQRIATCQRFLLGLKSLPPERRLNVPLATFEADYAEALISQREMLAYRQAAVEGLERFKRAMRKMENTAWQSLGFMKALAYKDEGALLACGLEFSKSKRIRTGVPGVPTELRARTRSESITLIWKSPMRRSLFKIQFAEGSPDNGWQGTFHAVKARHTFPHAVPGTLYWFRVMAWNANGESDWSSPIMVRAI
jgi:hypothetical protein